jgi:hypothetical protein
MAFDVAKVASPVAATAGGAFVSLGSFALEQQPQAVSLNDPSIPAATMILGAREQLGVGVIFRANRSSRSGSGDSGVHSDWTREPK